MNSYDGTLVTVRADYSEPFLTVEDGKTLHSVSKLTWQSVVDIIGEDWFVKEFDDPIECCWNGQKLSVPLQYAVKVHVLGNKANTHGIMMFVAYDENAEKQKVYLNCINMETKKVLAWCPDVFEGTQEEYETLAVASTTPNTKAFVFGTDILERHLAFYTTVMRRMSDDKEDMSIVTNPYEYTGTDYEFQLGCASLMGNWAECFSTNFFNIPRGIDDEMLGQTTYVLNQRVVASPLNMYVSIGDVFETIESKDSDPKRIVYKDVEYARYTKIERPIPLGIWFRIYGGENDV